MQQMHYDEAKALFISRKFYTMERYWKDVLEPECTDNWRMYNGEDEYIRRRAQENRSALQTPILFPAVEGRVSQIISRLKAREPIVRMQAADKTNPAAVLSALKIQEWIRSILERQNWLEELSVLLTASEIFPIVWVKCRLGEIEMTPSEQAMLGQAFGLPPQALAGEKRTVPEFEALSPGSVYYDFRQKRPQGFIEKFHVKPMALDEIHAMFGSDIVSKIEEFESATPQWEKEWETAAGRKSWHEVGEPRYRLAEGWINAHMSNGDVKRKLVRFFPDVIRDESAATPIGLLVDEDDPPMGFDPFRPVVSRRLPFHLPGKSTVGLGKALQRERAELTNMAIDILGYTAAPPIVMAKGSVDNPNQLRFQARSIWMLNDTSFPPQALHVPAPNAPFLESLKAQTESDMNHITAAYEGITGKPDSSKGRETLGAFRQRTAVGQGRLDLPFISYSGTIRAIVEKYWYYMREFPRTIIGKSPFPVQTPIGEQSLTVDDLDVSAMVAIPNLTEFENNEIKKIELDRAIERSAAFPIVQLNPQMQAVLLAMYWKAHVYDAADLQEIMRAAQQPLQPELAGAQNGTGMPQTQFSPGVGNIQRSAGLTDAASAGGG